MAASIANPASRRAVAGGIRTRTSAPVVDMCLHGIGRKFTAYVTNPTTGIRQRVAANDLSGPPNYYGEWVRFNFGSVADRILEIFTNASPNHMDLRGFDLSAGHSFAAVPGGEELRVVIVGDSHVDHAGSGNTNPVRLCYPDFLGQRLGTANVWCSAVGGRGFLNPGSLAAYGSSLAAGDLSEATVGKVDVVVLAGTTNDDVALNASFTDTAMTAAVAASTAAAMAAQPQALIVVPGPFGRTLAPSPGAHVTPQSRYDAIAAGVAAAAAGDRRVIAIDNSPAGVPWVTGANAAALIGPDGTHLTDAGMAYIGAALGDAIIGACEELLIDP